MRVWIDANLSPALAVWLSREFGLEAVSAERLNLLKANDTEIFQKAKENNAVILTKDSDFVDLVNVTALRRWSCGSPVATQRMQN